MLYLKNTFLFWDGSRISTKQPNYFPSPLQPYQSSVPNEIMELKYHRIQIAQHTINCNFYSIYGIHNRHAYQYMYIVYMYTYSQQQNFEPFKINCMV